MFRVLIFHGCLSVGAHQAGIWALWLAKCVRGNASTSPGVCYSSVPSSKVFPSLELDWKKTWNRQILEVGIALSDYLRVHQFPSTARATSVQVPKCHIPTALYLSADGDSRCVRCLCHLLPTSFVHHTELQL